MLQLVKVHYTHVLQLVTVHIHVHTQTCLIGKITHTRASAGNRGYARVLHVAKSTHTHVVLFVKNVSDFDTKGWYRSRHGVSSNEKWYFSKIFNVQTSYCCASYSRITL